MTCTWQPCIGTLVSSGVVISAKQWYRKTLELHPLLGATLIEKLQAALRSASWSAHEAFDHLNHTRWDGLGSDEALRESFLTALEKQIGRAPLPEELEDALVQEYDDLLTLEDVSEQLGESFCHSERIPDPELERLCVQNADFFALLETVRELEALPKLQFDNTRNGAMAHYIFATDQGWQDSADNLILETYTEEFSYYPEGGEEPSWYFLPLNSQNLKALCDLMRCESRLMNRVMDLIMDPLEE